MCIGNSFALMEAQVVLATLAQRFEPELVPGQDVVPDATFTLRPRHGVRMRIRRRAPAAAPAPPPEWCGRADADPQRHGPDLLK
jgi:hypothetical protein